MDGLDAQPIQTDMDIAKVYDRGGNSLTLQVFEGKYYFPFYRSTELKGIKSLQLRDDDIFFTGFPRTGTENCTIRNTPDSLESSSI